MLLLTCSCSIFPNSVRLMDVTTVAGTQSLIAFYNIDPSGAAATVTNTKINFGYEYVWHCHLLGHEENDMMRPMILGVAPRIAGAPVLSWTNTIITPRILVTWPDNSLNETGFTVQKFTTSTNTWATITTTLPNVVSFTDTAVVRRRAYSYRVIANNLVGYTATYAAPAVGYPNRSFDALPSPTSVITTP